MLGKSIVVPVKYNSSDKKNGLRVRRKIPTVTSFPVLFSFSPKRSDSLKWRRVVFKIITEIRTVKIPNNLRIAESKSDAVKVPGSKEKPVRGDAI